MRPHTRTQCTSGNLCSQCYPAALQVNGGPGSLSALSSTTSRAIILVELPAELLVKVLKSLSFKEICQVRLVCRRFNEICASILNSTFQRLQTYMLQRFQTIKSQMPRRESLRRYHPLSREADIVETLHMRLSLLQMTFGKHIERKNVCFFAGEILDEVQRILYYIRQTPSLARAYKVTDELFDLSTMAMEYFKEHIEPTLPEITCFGAEFLDFATPFSSPAKRRSQSGSVTSLLGIDSPCSSRASVAGSNSSEVWSTGSSSTLKCTNSKSGKHNEVDDDDEYEEVQQASQTTMILRKRIRRIRQGMKKYNSQLVEVKRELKACKTKMESQSKQVQDYSQRLEEYDKKFEESSRKFQTLLTELNKCKTELQYWRSRSTQLLSFPTTCSQCDAPLVPQASGTEECKDSLYSNMVSINYVNDLKPLANHDVAQNSMVLDVSDCSTGSKNKSGANSPPFAATTTSCISAAPSGLPASTALVIGGRKRRSREEAVLNSNETEPPRKSLRAASASGVATSARAKRGPKLASSAN